MSEGPHMDDQTDGRHYIQAEYGKPKKAEPTFWSVIMLGMILSFVLLLVLIIRVT